jgi:hypothetical protein
MTCPFKNKSQRPGPPLYDKKYLQKEAEHQKGA